MRGIDIHLAVENRRKAYRPGSHIHHHQVHEFVHADRCERLGEREGFVRVVRCSNVG